MPNLLLTGGSGLLALNWARVMAGSRWTVHRLEHSRRLTVSGSQGYHAGLDTIDQARHLLDGLRPDLVVNCAGLTSVEACEMNPDAARRVNADMPGLLASACRHAGVTFVHISTDHLFDDRAILFTEMDEPAPLNIYGLTKAEGERAVLEAAPAALVVRTNFFGWGTSYRRSFSDAIIGALRARQSTTLFDDVYFTPILMDQLVVLVHELVARQASGLYHAVGDERLTKYDFGVQVARAFGLDEGLLKRGKISDRPELVRRPRQMGLSNAKLHGMTGMPAGNVTSQLEQLAALESAANVKELQQL
ncbi:MAG: SDR family oxidoreductase [Proteobacteria bacterium]|nr:MAG: SDR family oxidoreductase [Pseudomonadota bacterium]